ALFESVGHTHANGSASDPIATMYVTNIDLPQTGWWTADISVKAGSKQYEHIKTRFFVDERTTVPAIGAPAPKSKQPVARDVKDLAEIDSSSPPRPELHQVTVAEAADSG